MISFQPTDEERAVVESLRRFAGERIRPMARPCERQQQLSSRLLEEYAALGLSDLSATEGALRARALIEEELAWGDPGISTALAANGLAADVLLALGSDLVRETMAGALFDGDPAVAAMGSPAAGWTLSGCKDDVPPGESFLIRARAGSEIMLFVCPARVAGVSLVEDSQPLGLRAFRRGKLELQHCQLPDSAVLARAESAVRSCRLAVQRQTVAWSARAIGTARAAFEYASRYATQRHAFGKPIAEHQAVAFMVADMGILVDAARSLTWYAAWAADAGRADCSAVIRAAAQYAAEAAVRVTTDAVQVLGGHGYVDDHPVELWMRDARCIANYLGRLSGLLAD